MLSFLISLIMPPRPQELETCWKGVLFGGCFALLFLILDLGDGQKGSTLEIFFDLIFAYLITFLAVIGRRIQESENRDP